MVVSVVSGYNVASSMRVMPNPEILDVHVISWRGVGFPLVGQELLYQWVSRNVV